MGEGNKFEINNTVNGGAQQLNIGQSGGKAELNADQSGPAITFEQFIQTLRQNLPADQIDSVQADVLDPLNELAAEPEPENEQDRVTLKARIMSLVEKLEPYTPHIRKTIAAFAEGALLAVPGANLAWGAKCVIAGCIEVVRDARND